jgi:hypothetical protein
VDGGSEGASNVPSEVIKGSDWPAQSGVLCERLGVQRIRDSPVDVLHVSQPDVGQLLTPDDVCALLKVKKSWLYDAVENGAVEAI